MACEFESIGDVGSVSERVQMLAPWINDQLVKFAGGELTIGVRTYQTQVLKAVMDAHLSEEIYYDIAKVGVHPDNRERVHGRAHRRARPSGSHRQRRLGRDYRRCAGM